MKGYSVTLPVDNAAAAPTVSITDEAMKVVISRPGNRLRAAGTADPDLARLEEDLAETLGAKVTIEPKANGAGKLVIGYSSLTQLDGILAKRR